MANIYTTQVQYPGLQLFTRGIQTSILDDKSELAYSRKMIPNAGSKQNLWHIDEITANSLNQRKISNLNEIEFNDSSPTIVNETIFNETNNIPYFFQEITDKVFKNLPYGIIDEFTEEYQYNIITSTLLNDLNSSVDFLKPKYSILDFSKNNLTSTRNQIKKSITTKYGFLEKLSNDKYIIENNLNYKSTIFSSLRVLQKLRSSKNGPSRITKRISIVILIAVYLAFQQEYFRIQYTKYKTVKVLKLTIKSLENYGSQLNNYHLRYQELNLHNINSVEVEYSVLMENKSKIANILILGLDTIYYKLIDIIKPFLLMCGLHEFSQYSEMFNISISDMEFYFMELYDSIDYKFERTRLLIKFMLCCFLSIRTSEFNSSVQNFKNDNDDLLKESLKKIFTVCPSNIRNSRSFSLFMVVKNMEELQASVAFISSMLSENREHLHKFIQEYKTLGNLKYILDEEGSVKERTINETLSKLPAQIFTFKESKYTDIETYLEEKNKLKTQLKILLNSLEEPNLSKPPRKIFQTKRIVSKNNSLGNGGFSLNIMKASHETPINIDQKVDFTHIEGDSDSLSDSCDDDNFGENIVSNIYNDDLFSQDHCQLSVQPFSDEQLQEQLNQEILKFSVENKKSRETLRNQKSFELLKRQNRHRNFELTPRESDFEFAYDENKKDDDVLIHDLNTINNRFFTSEESIPVLYNIEEILDQ